MRFPHMLLASYLTGAFCVAATGAWYLLRGMFHAEARIMLRMGLSLAAVLVPIQIFFGHLTGDYVHDYQPAKFAAIEGRWHDEQPAGEVLIALPDHAAQTNHYEIKIPVLGSLIGSMSFDSKEVGLTDFPGAESAAGAHSVSSPSGSWSAAASSMLALAWLGSYLSFKDRIERNRLLLWLIFLSFPLPFIAILDRLVHGRSRTPALDGLRRAADRRRNDAIPDDARGDDLARRLLRGLQLYLRLRHFLHLPARCAQAPSGLWFCRRRRRPQPPDVGRRRASCADGASSSPRENSHGHVLGRGARDQHSALRAARRL